MVASDMDVDDSTPTSSHNKFQSCEISFFRNINNATEKNNWLMFDEVIPSSTLKSLYVRESYKTIEPKIEPEKKAIITGTPGIGKSWFLIYHLFKLVRKEKRVLFIYHPNKIYYDGKGTICHNGI